MNGLKFEIGHVLFIDIVGYSKLRIGEQSDQMQTLREIVRGTEQFKKAQAEGKLLRLPTGDGGALVFRNSLEAPVLCALEISKALKSHPELKVRMGIHSGPVNEITDLNEQANIAGVGINLAQRVMDCGDAGHILLSKRVADDLEEYPQWRSHLSNLGECEVKHGTRVSVVNLYTDDAGNPSAPQKFLNQPAAVALTDALPRRGSKFPLIALAALVLAMVIAGGWWASRARNNLEGDRNPGDGASGPSTPATPNSQGLALHGQSSTGVPARNATDSVAGGRPSIPEKSIAVLPFENLSRDPDNAYFVEGIQDEILTRLAKIADLKVIARSSTQRFQNRGDLPQIAQQLGVAHLLEGSVQKVNDQVRINVQLIKATSEAHLWAEVYDRKLTDIFAVESEIAKTIADTLQAKLTGSEQQVIAAHPTENPEAHQLYLKGRFFWNKRTGNDLKKSIDYFEQAIAIDPNYALGYAGLADAYVFLPGYTAGAPRDCYPKAMAAAKKALVLDNNLAEAHTTLALALWYYDFDLSQANKEFQRAIELNPNYATGHQQYGNNTLSASGRFDDSIAEGKRAVDLDPLSLVINADLGVNYLFARRYDEAITQLRKTLEIDPGYYYAYVNLGQAFAAKRGFDHAIEQYQKAGALNDDPFVLGLLGHAYASSGNKSEALKVLDQLKQLAKQRYVSAYSFVIVYVGLGEKDEALQWLERCYQDHAGSEIAWIRVDPLVDPLREDPRFEALAEKIVPAREFHGFSK
jgi:TolB-like protein/tetratricopeptide (TPR) repeat protein/class 3 adenylate cyclase